MKATYYLTALAGCALFAGAAFASQTEGRKPVRISAAAQASLRAQSAAIPTDWVDMGQGRFTEDIITLYEMYDAPTYSVAVQQDAAKSGWYRIVNPFAGNPMVDDWSGCELKDDGDYYIVIDATDPDAVHIASGELGVIGFGEDLWLVSMSQYPTPYDFWLDEDEAAAMTGTLVDGVIAFEIEESLVITSEFGGEQTNLAGAFRLELPSGDDPDPDPLPQPDPLTPPFEESFATADFLETFTVLDVNDDKVTWQPYLGSVQVSYNSDLAMDDWLITPPLQLEGGKKYTFKVDVLTGNASDKETFEVMYGAAATPAALTETVVARRDIGHTKYETYEGVIAPGESGVYYVGIHGCSAADKYSISLKNLYIAEGAEAATPAAPTDLTAVTRTNGELKADITLKAPTVDLDGNNLESLDCVRLMRDGELIHTFEPVAPGESLSWVDEVPECSRYSYSATAVADGMEGPSTEVRAFVGVLEPANPASVTIADAEQAGHVTVTWEPVTADIRGNALDAGFVTYRIYEGGASTPMFTGLSGSSHTFKALDDVSGQAFVRYEVVAETRGGVSDFVTTAHHPVGEAYGVPYHESYADGEARYIMAADPDNTAEWYVFNDDPAVQSQDGDNGFIISEASYTDDVAVMHTGKIDLTGLAKPELSLYVYVIVDGDKDTNTLDIDVICDGTTAPLYSTVVGNLAETQGWAHVTVPMDDYKDHVVRLSFTARHDLNPYVMLDNILIDEAGASGIAAVAADTDGETEYYNLQGIRVANPENGIFIRRQGNKTSKVLVK